MFSSASHFQPIVPSFINVFTCVPASPHAPGLTFTRLFPAVFSHLNTPSSLSLLHSHLCSLRWSSPFVFLSLEEGQVICCRRLTVFKAHDPEDPDSHGEHFIFPVFVWPFGWSLVGCRASLPLVGPRYFLKTCSCFSFGHSSHFRSSSWQYSYLVYHCISPWPTCSLRACSCSRKSGYAPARDPLVLVSVEDVFTIALLPMHSGGSATCRQPPDGAQPPTRTPLRFGVQHWPPAWLQEEARRLRISGLHTCCLWATHPRLFCCTLTFICIDCFGFWFWTLVLWPCWF